MHRQDASTAPIEEIRRSLWFALVMTLMALRVFYGSCRAGSHREVIALVVVPASITPVLAGWRMRRVRGGTPR